MMRRRLAKDESFVHPMKPRCVVRPKPGKGVEETHCKVVQRIVWYERTSWLVTIAEGIAFAARMETGGGYGKG